MPKQITRSEWYANGLPIGMEIDPQTGVISGTPIDETGEYEVEVGCETNYGVAEEQIIKIILSNNLSITTTSLPNATAYSEYSVQIQLNKAGDYRFEAEGLPDGLYCDWNTGEINGIPYEYDVITESKIHTVSVSVYNSIMLLRFSREFSLTVEVPDNITGSLSAAMINIPYTQNLILQNADSIVGSLYVEVDGLPDGLWADSSEHGVVQICGTPEEAYEEDRTYPISVRFYDSGGHTLAYKEYDFVVRGTSNSGYDGGFSSTTEAEYEQNRGNWLNGGGSGDD